jgi:ZIP family zinc transporter
MQDLFDVLLLTFLAGLAIPLGGFISQRFSWPNRLFEAEINHFLVAFGGGALLSAVALVLVPKGMENLTSGYVALCFIGGGVAFMLLDRYQKTRGTSAVQLTAMLTDFVPEALALGALFSLAKDSGMVLAFIIFLQNLPEGYNAFKELSRHNKHSANSILLVFFLLVLLGPIAGFIGFYWLSGHVAILSGIMIFAAGGIIYTSFQNIAPLARLKYHWAPPLGAVFGFTLGMMGHMMLHY